MRQHLPLSALNTFATAAAHLSFQEAATVLHVTPSAVSHQIRKLETLLGYPLFERRDKHVVLTERGQRLFQAIRLPLEQLHEASVHALRLADDHRLSLSVAPVFATRWLLPRLSRFHARHPEINLSVIADSTLVDFRKAAFDAAIRMGTGHWAETEAHFLFSRQLVAVCHPDTLGQNPPWPPEALLGQPLIHNSATPEAWQAWFASAGVRCVEQPPGLSVPGAAQVMEALQTPGAIGLMDKAFITQALADGQVVIASTHVLRDDEGYYLTWPAQSPQTPALRKFAAWLDDELKESSPDEPG
ncbi:MAG: LysR family transcriptional regulator [Gammaproteobacteria bacterium]|nr:MAG: LysR family transcriptional regulator [Gammaproteobacteria bacterium]